MEIKNLAGLEKPLQKLVETVSEGIGVVGNHVFEFDVAKIKRIGLAEANVEKQKIVASAEGQEKAVEILSRAEKRFALEQYNKQINLENIVVKTREYLSGKVVSNESVEKDWVVRFLDVAQNVGREELQDILAKILSGEIQRPGSFSYQTLETTKYFSKKDLEIFQRFVAISTDTGFVRLSNSGFDSLEKYGLSFGDYLNLSSIGIFNQSSTLSFDIDLPAKAPIHSRIGNDWFWISHEDEGKNKRFDLRLFVFSNAGREISSLLFESAKNDKAEEYKEDFAEEIKKRGFKIVRQEKKLLEKK
jgi:hypothetical protein